MSPGYMWDGGYLCWSLKELADINMTVKASKHPSGLQGIHVTKKIRLPNGNVCHFPPKEKYDRQFRTIDGIGELQTVVQSEESVEKHLVCPDGHVDKEVPDVTATNIAGSSSGAVLPPQPGVLNRLDVHLGIGYEFDGEGHLCRRVAIKRLNRVDEYGRITNRSTT